MLNRTYIAKLRPTIQQNKELLELHRVHKWCFVALSDFSTKMTRQGKKINRSYELKRVIKELFNSSGLTCNKSDIVDSVANDFLIELKASLESPRFKHIPIFNDFEIEGQVITFCGIENIKLYNTPPLRGCRTRKLEVFKKEKNWFVRIDYQKEQQTLKMHPSSYIGIDVGLKEFAYFSNGKKISNPRFYRTMEEKIIKEQRKLSRKVKNSNNWHRQRRKLNRLHSQLYSQRMNFLHKLSSILVQNYDVIGIEKLAIKDMASEKKFSKSIFDASWGAFVKMLKYKAEEQGKHVIEVGRYYPSSQLCSACGSKSIMPYHLRTYKCKSCNTEIDRDYNASINIKNKAKEIFNNKY